MASKFDGQKLYRLDVVRNLVYWFITVVVRRKQQKDGSKTLLCKLLKGLF